MRLPENPRFSAVDLRTSVDLLSYTGKLPYFLFALLTSEIVASRHRIKSGQPLFIPLPLSNNVGNN